LRRRGGAPAAAWIAGACAAGLAAAPAAAAGPAAGGVRLLSALERAPVAVVLVLEAPSALDAEAWSAYGTVERAFRGAQTGERLRIAWEERARGRPVRFAAGDRVLLALEPLPGHSIWRQRIPGVERRAKVRAVAEQGDAFLRAPSPGGLLTLQHYLALPPDLREQNAGVGYLVDLAEGAELPLAAAAVERLAAVPSLDSRIDPSSAAACVRALLRDDAPAALTDAWLALIGDAPLRALKPSLAALAQREPPAPARVYEALGRIDGELPAELSLRLLALRDAPELRAAGARFATGAALAQLPRLLRSDPAPAVRTAAAERWLEREGVAGIDAARPALRDADREVRFAALMAVARLGPPAVPALRDEIGSAPPDAARIAVGALVVAGGSEAAQALSELAETHPDEGVRLLARTALGRPIGHKD
jgi:hypothetical protein